jgi:hypothetical protein
VAKQTEVYDFVKKVKPFVIVKKYLIIKANLELKNIVNNQKLKKKLYFYRKKEIKNLRNKGLTYREIGRKLKIDWGYVRRLNLDLN